MMKMHIAVILSGQKFFIVSGEHAAQFTGINFMRSHEINEFIPQEFSAFRSGLQVSFEQFCAVRHSVFAGRFADMTGLCCSACVHDDPFCPCTMPTGGAAGHLICFRQATIPFEMIAHPANEIRFIQAFPDKFLDNAAMIFRKYHFCNRLILYDVGCLTGITIKIYAEHRSFLSLRL